MPLPPQLETGSFADIVRLAPLISIDLIVRRQDERAYLGRCTQPPASGWWFVHGRRIRKDERLAVATTHLLTQELGWTEATTTQLRGVHEHFYPQNFQGTRQFVTHYIVLAYDALLEGSDLALPLAQRWEYRWLSVPELFASRDVHPYTQDSFRGDCYG